MTEMLYVESLGEYRLINYRVMGPYLNVTSDPCMTMRPFPALSLALL